MLEKYGGGPPAKFSKMGFVPPGGPSWFYGEY